DGVTPPYFAYRYLPAVAQFAAPVLARLQPWTAYRGWLLVLEAVLLLNLWGTRRLFSDHGSALPWLYALWFLYTPLWLELQMGQFSLAVSSLIFWTGLLLRDGYIRSAAAPWIASVLLKVYPLVLLPVWWRLRRLGTATLAAAAVAVACLPGFLSHRT